MSAFIDETERLACLHELEVLDSAAEPVFDQLSALAARSCDAPVALISLIDAERQWFKSNIGMPGVCETPRAVAFCAHTIGSDELLVVEDATQDPRFADYPAVTGKPGVRFYAGAPLRMPGGERIGTLCVVDHYPRTLTEWQRQTLSGLADIAVTTLLNRGQRIKLGRELQRTQAHYRLIVEAQSELVSLANADGVLTYVNPAYAQFFGRRSEDMVGRNLLEFVADVDRASVFAHLQMVLATQTPIKGVNRLIAADGSERWVEWTNRCVSLGESSAASVQSIGRDITHQQLAERALAESERRSRMLYEATPAMLHSIDARGQLTSVSDAWLHALGYEHREEVIGRKSVDFLTPESRQRAIEVVLPRFFRTGQCENVPYQMVRKDGSVIDILISAVTMKDGDGHGGVSLAVLRDVTEARATAAQLDETDHILQLVLDNMPARISYWDLNYCNRFANKSFRAWYGMTDAALTGRHLRDVVGEMFYERAVAPFAEVQTGKTVTIESTFVDAAGQRHDSDMRIAPDLQDGAVRGIFVFALDVTARRAAERDLVSQQAATAQALAEKETLLKEVYHRVKNNLQVVQSLLNLQRQSLPDGDAKLAIQDSAQRVRAMALVHEKLYQSANLAAVALPAYTRELVTQIAEAYGSERRQIRMHVDVAPIETKLDSAVPYGLLITELLTNCLKHAFPETRGGGDVWIRVNTTPTGAVLKVRDNGVGFPVGFDWRSSRSSLGLTLAESLAGQLGGRLTLEADDGPVLTATLTRL